MLDTLPERCLLVLDEAYYEYADDPAYTRSIEWIRQGRNVIALRTFSKIYALAGTRVGYGVAPKRIIDHLERVRAPFNVNSIAQAGALASLADPDQVTRSREQNRRVQGVSLQRARQDGHPIHAHPGELPLGRHPARLQGGLRQAPAPGVIVRTGDIFGCPTHIRVTTGTDEQNAALHRSA